LEKKLQAQVNIARSAFKKRASLIESRRSNGCITAGSSLGNAYAKWIDNAAIANDILWVIKGIKHLSAKFQFQCFGKFETLIKREVPVVDARGSQCACAHSRHRAQASLDKSSVRVLGEISNYLTFGVGYRSNAAARAGNAMRVENRAIAGGI